MGNASDQGPGDTGETEEFEPRLGASDSVLWDIEKDPVLRSTITAVALLDRAPDWPRLRRRLEHGSHQVPRLRQRVVVPPLRAGAPRWVDDHRFDLDYHLRRVRVPEDLASGDDPLRAALDLAQPLAMAPFDRARPLWEFTVVEGLPGGRAALVQKVHHTVTDGVGGIRLALMLVDGEPEAPEPEAFAPRPVAPPPGALGLVAGSLVETAAGTTRNVARLPAAAVAGARGLARRPVGAVRDAARLGGSVARLVRPVTEPCSPLMRERGLARHLEAFEVPFEGLRAAGHAVDGHANDAFLAAVVGGLADYHRHHDVSLRELRFTMPINVRHEGDPMGGNRFVPARFAVPAYVRDPRARMAVVGRVARDWRDEPSLALTEPIAAALDRLPVSVTTALFGGMLKGVDAVVTNVPGVPVRHFLAGAEVVREWAFAPPSGAALSVALLSHVGMGCVGLTIDTASVPDPDVLAACLRRSFDETVAVGGA
ncbi:MAG: DUF1298 domain-containing protein [Acidimicrobiales bacterium]|nr:DUF1298 domain-containing protein [Acidimicrobiales bacterium]